MPIKATVDGVLGLFGLDSASKAAETQAQAQRDIAASQAFKPYGVTTPFGTSQFTTAEQAAANQQILSKLDPSLVQRGPDGSFNARRFLTRDQRMVMPGDDPSAYAGELNQEQYNAALQAAGVTPGHKYATTPQATVNRSQPVQQGTASALQFGQEQLGKVRDLANVNPETLRDSQFQRYLEFVRPSRAAELDKTLGGLALTGNLGYLNGNTGTNPVLQSLQEANNRSDQDVFGQFTDRARAMRTQDINQALSLGQQGFSTAGNIDALAGNTIDQGAALGGRAGVQSNAAAGALSNAAGITANNSLNNTNVLGNILNSNNPATQRIIDWFKNPATPATAPQNRNPGDYMPAEGFNYSVG